MKMDEEILLEWNPWWEEEFSPKYVERDKWEEIKPWIKRKEVISLTGTRRSGKTTLMYIAIKKLLKEFQIPRKNILFIKCDDERIEEPIIEKARGKHSELMNPEGRTYLFLDEAQNAKDWNKTVKRIYDLNEEEIKIFLSGSRLMEKEISSTLAGRSSYFNMYPFSFREILKARKIDLESELDKISKQKTIKHILREYIEWGGFPEVVLEEEEDMKKELLRFYSDTILYRDVIERSSINKPQKIEKLKNYLLTNLTNLLSYNKIGKHLGISTDTAERYVSEMEKAHYIFQVPIFAYSIKKQQTRPKKIYCVDNGLKNAIGFRFSRDVGKLYENAVFLDLKRNKKEVYYWKDEKGKEVDFLVSEGDEIKRAIQVCYDFEKAEARETKALFSCLEKFNLDQGVVVTGEYEGKKDYKGKEIRCIPLWKWLLRTLDKD